MIYLNLREEFRRGKNIFELPLKVSYYARVSTLHDEQISSIMNQIDYFIKYIEGINCWSLVGGYVDEGISGKEVKRRDNFIRMINDARDGKFDLILTKSVSRFARNTIDSIYYTGLLLDMGVGVIFINDNINTIYPDSEFRLTLMASIAQDELRKLSESVKFGLRQSINRGVVLGSSNILGFKKDNGRLVIVFDEALIVKDIFNLFISGNYNYSKIARKINDKYNRRFNSSSIKRILTNCKYKGFYCGGKSEVIDYKTCKRKVINEDEWIVYKADNIVPAIVEERVWDRVNSIIDNKKNIYRDKYYDKVFCCAHGNVKPKVKKNKNKLYFYYICKGCFSISSRLLDIMVKDRDVESILVNSAELLKLDIVFK